MPGRVGQRLSHDVIGADLDRLRQPLFGMDLQVDGDRAAAGECPEREAEAALGQDRGVNAARELAAASADPAFGDGVHAGRLDVA